MSILPHDRSALLTLSNLEYTKYIREFFSHQLELDGTDITTTLLIDTSEQQSDATIVAKNSGICAGKEELEYAAHIFFPNLQIIWNIQDKGMFLEDQEIIRIQGRAREILKFERVFLNFLSRMSGIATATQEIQNVLPSRVFVAATRKTFWKFFDKKAVSVGGGLTHRLGLFDGVLVKENHLALLPHGAKEAAEKIADVPASEKEKLGSFWEIEVENPSEFFSVLSVFDEKPSEVPGVIMCDNFSPRDIESIFLQISKAKYHQKHIFFEASGGITVQNISEFMRTGVDVISCGFLTHSSRALDFSLRMKVKQ